MTVNILGTEYTFTADDLNNRELAENDGVCFTADKRAIIRKPCYLAGSTEQRRKERFRHVIRHELIHAFATESAVSYDDDEQLVDWIAAMIPKINRAAEAIEEQI